VAGHAILGILSGFVSGVIAGAFGVGGAILTTPAVQVLLGAPPLVALGTPLPVILPTTVAGTRAYRRAGQIDNRAVGWAVPPGILGAVGGAALTKLIDAHILLLVTACLIGWQAIRVGWGTSDVVSAAARVPPSGRAFALMGLSAGFVSGLLGIGGGVVMVPVMVGVLHMPLKRSLGTSLVIIAFLVIPGTIVHAFLGHINWTIFGWLSIGVIPGAVIGSRWTLRARERTLRLTVGVFLLAVALAYAGLEVKNLIVAAGR